ncbi:MAG: TIGR04283 family arsenosugar biosynthesis glycosyltransferase [Planctomycetes bacterium]|nr:TIGR04283 family arsenosugar biosynthesis glycosyltransferase [Planctomycetota bacterium]
MSAAVAARVSVIVPALADGAALTAHLPRLAREREVAEVIVADGGGNDAAAAAIAACGALRVPCGGGRGPQLNAGAAAARSELLLFLHADCWLADGALDEACARLLAPGVGAVVFRQRIEGERFAYRLIEAAASRRARVHGSPYGDSGLLLRRADFERIGGFPPLPIAEDLAMAPRLSTLGAIVETERPLHLSARRWERHGIVKTTLLNRVVAWGFRLGVAPAKLYRVYYGRSPESLPVAATSPAGEGRGA